MEEVETNFTLELLPPPKVVLLTPGPLPQLKLFPMLQIPPPMLRLLPPPYPVPTVVLVTAARRRRKGVQSLWVLASRYRNTKMLKSGNCVYFKDLQIFTGTPSPASLLGNRTQQCKMVRKKPGDSMRKYRGHFLETPGEKNEYVA